MEVLTASVEFHELAMDYRAARVQNAQAAYERLCAFLEARESTFTTIIATKDGEIAALTAEVTHLAEKLAERDAGVDRNSGERAKALNEAWSICIAQADRARSSSGAARAMACADEIHRLAAAPQPVDAAQAVPSVKQLTAQLHDGQTWTVAEQRAFAQVLAAFPNESSQGIISLGDAWKHGQAYGEATVSKATRTTCAEASQKLRTYIGIYTGDKQARRLADQLANIATSIAQPTDTTKGA